MKIKEIREIQPELARCIEVDSPDRLFAVEGTRKDSDKNNQNSSAASKIITHNSVIQRNILFGAILRPDSWRVLCIDLKKVELSGYRAYSNVVLGVATTIEDALTVLRFAQQTMMKRYAEMESLGVNNFLDLPEQGQALMLMVDEAGELLSPSGVKALVSSTILPTPDGKIKLENLNIGDTIYDNYGQETVITNKYTPVEQSRYEIKITSDKTKISENFVAGSEHNWVAYFTYPDGEVEGPEIVDTQYLYEFKKHQETFPIEERTTVKFKKG